MLMRRYSIRINKESLRQFLIEKGIWIVNVSRPKHRSQRPRKLMAGEMIQLDGSDEAWFEERGPRSTLLNFIDDASSLDYGQLAKSENLHDIFKVSWDYFETVGIPCSLYVDFGKVFRVNLNNPDHDKITQWERAMAELDIKVIHAHSPQAKGRVERSHETHQDRLIKELRLEGISNIDDANKFIQNDYMPRHNTKFAVKPAREGSAYRSAKGIDLNNILCIKTERYVQNDFVVRYNTRQFQLRKHQQAVVQPKEYIMVHEHLDGTITLWTRGIQLNYREILKPVSHEKEGLAKGFENPSSAQRIFNAWPLMHRGIHAHDGGANAIPF